jgi:hypothetical protein
MRTDRRSEEFHLTHDRMPLAFKLRAWLRRKQAALMSTVMAKATLTEPWVTFWRHTWLPLHQRHIAHRGFEQITPE